MSTPCQNCGRNIETVTHPIEWKAYVFCCEPCYSNYLRSRRIKHRNSDHTKKKKIDRINGLPTPLQIVIWLNTVIVAICLIESSAYMTSVPLSTHVENAFGILLSVLIITGIIQASRFLRIFVLICSWIAAIMMGIIIPLGLFHIGPLALLGSITLAVSVVTIWGLSTHRSKNYFGY